MGGAKHSLGQVEHTIWLPTKPLKLLQQKKYKNHHMAFAMIYASAFYLNLAMMNFRLDLLCFFPAS